MSRAPSNLKRLDGVRDTFTHSKCRERLRPCHPHILPGQPCRSVQVLDFGTLLFLQVGSHWYRLDLRTSTKSEPASLSIMVQLTRSNVEVIFPLAHIFSLCFTSRYCIHLHLCMPYFTHCTLSLLLTDSPLVCLPLHCLFLSPCSHRLVLLPLYCNGMLSSMFNFNLLHSYQLLFHISFPGILCKSHVPILFLPFPSLPTSPPYPSPATRGWLLIHCDVVLNLAPKLALESKVSP